MVLLTSSLPFFSSDIGLYLIAAKNLIIFKANPYLVPLNYSQSDSWVKYMGSNVWMGFTTVYGPVSLVIATIAVFISSHSFYFAILIYKLFVLIAALLSLYLFSRLDKSEGKTATLLFLLNPILLFHILLDGHNEVFVLLSLLAFFYFWTKEQKIKSYLSVLGGIFVKYSSVVLLPAFFIENKKVYWKKAIVSCLLAALLFGLFALTFKINIGSILSNKALSVNKQCMYYCTPFVSFARYTFGNYANTVRIIVFLFVYGAIVTKYLFKKFDIYRFAFWAFMILFFIASESYLPWYAICPIAAGLLINDEKYRSLVIALTIYSSLYFFGIFN